MDEPRAGEWGTVIHEHCAGLRLLGLTVKVLEIEPAEAEWYLSCPACKGHYAQGDAHALIERPSVPMFVPLKWLRRLPPAAQVVAFDIQAVEPLPANHPMRAEAA